MKKEKNKNKIIKKIIIILAILIVALLLTILFLKNNIKDNEEVIIISQEEREESITNYVRPRGEAERTKTYIAEFLKHLEREEYSLAYEKLHPDFRQKFFKTENSFVSYARRNYSNSIAVTYENTERYGKYYILSLDITNLDGMCNEVKQKYIIQENGINDYYISFQVQL
ncbi:MAG: hypothetical protein IKP28_02405 [Clostridia bacterium]|nr:hypothetical protein [Clostridia bacterium]